MRWEYQEVRVQFDRDPTLAWEPSANSQEDARLMAQVAPAWYATLNKLGRDGWELISENTYVYHGINVVGSAGRWGTMKRQA